MNKSDLLHSHPGIALAQAARGVAADRLEMIAVTAYASDEYRERCRRAGFSAHLAKPYDTEELVRRVLDVASRV